MRRFTRRLVSPLIALSLLAGVWLPPAPAAAETSNGCNPGQFYIDDDYYLRTMWGEHCYPLPVDRTIQVDAEQEGTITGTVLLSAGTYRFTTKLTNVWEDFWENTTVDLSIDGELVLSSKIAEERSTTRTFTSDGPHTVQITIKAIPNSSAWNSLEADMTLRIEAVECPTGHYKLNFIRSLWSRVPLFGTCYPDLNLTTTWRQPAEVELEEYYVIAIEGPATMPPHSRVAVSYPGGWLQQGGGSWEPVVEEDGFIIFENGESAGRLQLWYNPPSAQESTLKLLAACEAGEWMGLYYYGDYFTGPATVPSHGTCEARPDYDWAPYLPGPWAGYSEPPTGNWRATWETWLDFAGGTYHFSANSSGTAAFTLQVNDQEWDGQSIAATIDLPAGPNRVRLDFTADRLKPNRSVSVTWQQEGAAAGEPPRCPGSALLAEYRTVRESTAADLVTCETPGVNMGQRHPSQWSNLSEYYIRWSGDLLLPGGQYTFTAQAEEGNQVHLWLNGHQVLTGPGSAQYLVEQQAYRVEGGYTGDGSESGSLISWHVSTPGVLYCPDDYFAVRYFRSPGDDKPAHATCQPLTLPDPETGGPPFAGDTSLMTWNGWVTFAPGSYLVYGPDPGLRLTLTDSAGNELVLDRWAKGAPEPESWHLDGQYRLRLEYLTTQGQPLPRVWWSLTDTPHLVSYTFTDENTISLTFDREVRSAPTRAGDAFFVYHANGARVGVSSVAVSGREVDLTLDSRVLEGQRISLSYFPGPEEKALVDAAVVPTGADLALGKPAREGAGNPAVPVSGVTGPLGGGSERDALVLSRWDTDWQVDLQDEYAVDEVWIEFTHLPSAGELVVATAMDNSDWRNWTDVARLDLSSLAGGSDKKVASLQIHSPLVRHIRVRYGVQQLDQTVGISRVRVHGSPANVVDFIPTMTFAHDVTAPELARRNGTERIELNVDQIVLTYNEALDTSSVPAPADYTVMVDKHAYHPTTVVVQGNTVTLYLPVSVQYGQQVTLTYTQGALRDLAGHQAPGFTDRNVDRVSVEMVDLARYGSPTARQSSTHLDDEQAYGARLAIDDDRSTSARTKREEAPWWQVDLGQVSTLYDLNLFLPAEIRNRPPTFLILLSDDGKNWASAYYHGGSRLDETGLSLSLNGRKARYVRIESSEYTYLMISDIEIWGFPN